MLSTCTGALHIHYQDQDQDEVYRIILFWHLIKSAPTKEFEVQPVYSVHLHEKTRFYSVMRQKMQVHSNTITEEKL